MPERAAFVTGASSGIGLAIDEVLGETGHGLTAEEDVQRVVAAHRERFGRLDVLVNSAGVGIGAPVAEIQTKRADMQLDLNLRAIVLFSGRADLTASRRTALRCCSQYA